MCSEKENTVFTDPKDRQVKHYSPNKKAVTLSIGSTPRSSRGPLIFQDKWGRRRDLPLPDLSRKIEGPLLAGYIGSGQKEFLRVQRN